jgi:hypothetical protein
MKWWFDNGGEPTYKAFSFHSAEKQEAWLLNIANLPESCWYFSPKGHSIFLSHAGTDLSLTEQELKQRYGYKPYLWNRKHMGSPAPVTDGADAVYQVHGHTPVQKIQQGGPLLDPTVLFYDDHKYDIDLCSCVTGKAALIDLDTFDVHYFYNSITQ